MVVTGLILLSIAVSDRAERRRAIGATQRWARETESAAAAALEERSAARIAALEARLAREQEQLDAAVASLASDELALRQELVDAVAELVGRGEPGQTVVLATELEALLEKAR